MTLAAEALDHLKVKDLQRELKKRGLDTSGLKAALLQRLKEHLQQEEKETTEANGDGKETESDVEKENDQVEEGGDVYEEERHEAEPVVGKKRGAEAVEEASDADTKKAELDEESLQPEDDADTDAKKPKSQEQEETSLEPEDELSEKPTISADAESEKTAAEHTAKTEREERKTLRIDNFIRPFTLNSVKALVQECGEFVEDGFWMDAIKTHCFVTYPTAEIAEKTSGALNGKTWPPDNGRSLKVTFVDHTAMEVSQFGEANLPSRPKSNGSSTQTTHRQKVTIDEFFLKTETKPVLYYLPLTDEQIKEKKQNQQQDGPPRKRRHRGGRKRNKRARLRR